MKLNISKSYGDKLVFDRLALEIDEGEILCILGESGGGKTTICNLLPRFYLRDSGMISIGGTDVNTVSSDCLREKIAFVAQDVFLFAGSIRAVPKIHKKISAETQCFGEE